MSSLKSALPDGYHAPHLIPGSLGVHESAPVKQAQDQFMLHEVCVQVGNTGVLCKTDQFS